MKIGYARVSTDKQNLDIQVNALKEAGCEKIFQEIVSSMSEELPEKNRAISFLDEGDTLVVLKLDRLARSTHQLLNDIENIRKRGAEVLFLRDNIDTATSGGKFQLVVFSALAEFERNLISERTKLGLEAVKKRGKKLGRPRGMNQKTITKCKIVNGLLSQGYSIEKACKEVSISRSSYYSFLSDKSKD